MFCFDILFPVSQPVIWGLASGILFVPNLPYSAMLYDLYNMMGKKKHLPRVVTVRYVSKRPNKAGEERK